MISVQSHARIALDRVLTTRRRLRICHPDDIPEVSATIRLLTAITSDIEEEVAVAEERARLLSIVALDLDDQILNDELHSHLRSSGVLLPDLSLHTESDCDGLSYCSTTNEVASSHCLLCIARLLSARSHLVWEHVFECKHRDETGMDYEAMYEISIRLSDESLASLARTPLWPLIARASRDQTWWFRRVEFLLVELGVSFPIESRSGRWSSSWSSVYSQIAKHGLNLGEYDAGNLLLMQVGLEIADPSSYPWLIDNAVQEGNPDAVALLLSDTRVKPMGTNENPLVDAVYAGNLASFKLLLGDKRIDPTVWSYENPFQVAVDAHETEFVRLFLEDGRVDPTTAGENEALLTAAKHGYADIYQLLISDARVQHSIQEHIKAEFRVEYGLQNAVIGSHIAVLRLILKHDIGPEEITRGLLTACKGSSYQTVELLFRDPRCQPSLFGKHILRVARNGKRADVVDLLLTDEHGRR